MSKTLYLTLRVEMDDLPSALRGAMADDMETPLPDLPGLAEATADAAAEAIAATLDGAGSDDQLLVGTGVNARVTAAKAISAEWG